MSTFQPDYGPSSKAMLGAAGRFLAGEGKPWLILAGTSGAGKSHLATAITLGLCAQGVSARYETAEGFIDKMRDSEMGTVHPDEDTAMPASHRLATYTHVPVLVLDDIRADQITTPWQIKVLDKLIDHRYQSGAPTVWTTNCLRNELGERMGRRLLDDREIAEHLFVEAPNKTARRAA